MSHASRLRAAPVVMLLIAACTDAPTTPLTEHVAEPPAGLDFMFPAFDRGILVMASAAVADEALSAEPARVEGDEPPLPENPPPPPADAASGIYDARTFVYFNPDHVYAQGEHKYQGNKSSIYTTLNVAFDGQQIGAQTGMREDDRIFVLDFGLKKYIQAVARVFSNQKCGLSAWASSEHRAGWEAVIGGAVSRFGQKAVSTYSSQQSQPACEPPPPPPPPPSRGGGRNDETSARCWVSVWYDLDTGEIVDFDVLFCEPIGG